MLEPRSGRLYASAVARWQRSRHLRTVTWLLFFFLVISFLNQCRLRLAVSDAFHSPGWKNVGTSAGPVQDHDAFDITNQAASMEAAGNSTLGFNKIVFINVKKRYDREDAMAIQAYLAGLDIEDYPAVTPDMIISAGMPPSHRINAFKSAGIRGCYRAHANVWSEMVRKRSPPVLIMESDAAWDINLRPIMSDINKQFVKFLHKINSTSLPDPSYAGRFHSSSSSSSSSENTKPSKPVYDRSDPWLSSHWDLFSFGQCREGHQDHDIKLEWPAVHPPAGKFSYYGTPLNKTRVLRKSGGIICLTAYAVSHQGAAKLLLRHALDLDNPVDVLMQRMVMSRDVVAYSVNPPVVAQWAYRDGIGMAERGSQSDVNIDQNGGYQDTPENATMNGWKEVQHTGTVWKARKGWYNDGLFENMALAVAWKNIMPQGAELRRSMRNPPKK
ncbi:hypothetical protein B0T14DRAFT_485437 [Immersiella caudata]|uniref:Glycosyl transferase family 25 domain-containing protein n=1 Tax=Immersiella caudata TaxID=314043 RepID=A0AA39WE02_9PEZI|nr:hypothetical protein B0T14DRAFT_485437 [Immersiella caudata]